MFGLFQTDIPAAFNFPLVAALAAFIALPVKVLVDVVKAAIPKLKPEYLPAVGLVTGYAFSVIVLVAAEIPFKKAVWAQCLIAAVMALVGAMAATALQTKVNMVDETINAALKADAGTTRAEIDKQVKKENT